MDAGNTKETCNKVKLGRNILIRHYLFFLWVDACSLIWTPQKNCIHSWHCWEHTLWHTAHCDKSTSQCVWLLY